jgi:4-hydroxy-3-polyprenylbenzoate decarboxylase
VPQSPANRPPTLVVGVTGASGAPYAVRLIECAVRAGRRIELIVTAAGRLVLADETPARFDSSAAADFTALWPKDVLAKVTYTPAEDLAAPPASGGFDAEAAIIIPCSMNTLAALACGLSANLVQRAGAVALKEGRPLIVVPREMPMTPIDMENMARLARAGAVVMPAAPGFYHHPRSVADLVDFVVAKVLDRLGIEHDLAVRWPGAERP